MFLSLLPSQHLAEVDDTLRFLEGQSFVEGVALVVVQ